MNEINFCPSCDSPGHRIVRFNEELCFCKVCNSFFNLSYLELKCPKCNNLKVKASDFPSPTGEIIFHCERFKKMSPASIFLKKNKVKA